MKDYTVNVTDQNSLTAYQTTESYIYIYIYIYMFTNGLGDQGSIPGRVIPKTQKIVLDASLLGTQHY